MSISSSFFCEYCGAANEKEASYCCFCGRPLDEVEIKPTNISSFTGLNTLPIDTLLKGRYRITKAVGQGGMGTVYQAHDTALSNRAVAIKELVVNDPETQDSKEAIEAFKREAILLASLQHANLPSVFEQFTENGRWYMTMTFIQGQTLEDYLDLNSRKKLPLQEVLEIGKQLSAVLYYLHNQYPPIIFRDVKPANIMRTPDSRIYLIDFGVARRFKTGQKKDTTPFGSLGYAAPEQFGKAQTTPRSDIYGLGATMYELLTGHEPASTPLKMPPLRALEPSMPFKLVTLIAQMLDQDESKRPANMLIVEQRLQEIGGDPWQTTTFPAFSSIPTSTPQKPSRKRLSILIMFLALGLIVGGFAGDLIGTFNNKPNVEANISATASAFETNISATASAQANATATAVQSISLPDPYPPKGTLVLFDTLSKGDHWQENADSDWGGSCQFKDEALQVSQTKPDKMYECYEAETNVFQNMAIQVKMTTTGEGDCGGIVLRENRDDSKFYKFAICADGSYGFYEYLSEKGYDALTLASGDSSALNLGVSENTIAVVANGNEFAIYANHKKLASFTDSAYDMGLISLFADADYTSTAIFFQDIMVWTLP